MELRWVLKKGLHAGLDHHQDVEVPRGEGFVAEVGDLPALEAEVVEGPGLGLTQPNGIEDRG